MFHHGSFKSSRNLRTCKNRRTRNEIKQENDKEERKERKNGRRKSGAVARGTVDYAGHKVGGWRPSQGNQVSI
jgi:hypothetical protein